MVQEEAALRDGGGGFGEVVFAEFAVDFLTAGQGEVDVFKMPRGVVGDLAGGDLVEVEGFFGLSFAQQDAGDHAGERAESAGVRLEGLPFAGGLEDGRRHFFFGLAAEFGKDVISGRVGFFHERHAEEDAQGVVDAVVVVAVGAEGGRVGFVVLHEGEFVGAELERSGQIDHRADHGAGGEGLTGEREVDVVVEPFPTGRAVGTFLAEDSGDVAEDGAFGQRGGAEGLLGERDGAPRHGVEIAGFEERGARRIGLAGAGQHLTEEEAGAGVARGELDDLAEKIDRLSEVVAVGGLSGFAEETAEFALLLLVEAAEVVFAERGEAGFIARRGADHGRNARGADIVEHGAEVGREIAGGGFAQRGVGGNDRLADHFFHQALVFVGPAVEPAVEHLHEGKAARGAHPAQSPRRERAGRIDRGRAVGAEEFIVAGVENEEIGGVTQRVADLVNERKAGHGGGAEIDHLHVLLRPGVGEHGLQER